METNEEIEMLLWEYMDGTCNEADTQRVSMLVAHNDIWKQKYAELSALQAELTNSLQLEQPSLRFSKNIMEAVAATHISPATKKYINKNIIRGIAAFFLISITTMIGYVLASAKWVGDTTTSTPNAFSRLNLNKINFSNYFNSSTLNIFIAINVIVGLLLLDTFLRRKSAGVSGG